MWKDGSRNVAWSVVNEGPWRWCWGCKIDDDDFLGSKTLEVRLAKIVGYDDRCNDEDEDE